MNLSTIKGIGPARLKALGQHGILTVRDLVLCLPSDYRDLTQIRKLSSLYAGDVACVRVTVAGHVREQRAKRLLITKVRVCDDSESMNVVWYNQPWLKQQLAEGRELLLYGRCEAKYGELQLTAPAIETEQGLISVYRGIPGVPPRTFRKIMELAVEAMDGSWPEELPEPLRVRHQLAERNFAIRASHFPITRNALEAARRRLAFEELLLYQIALQDQRGAGRPGISVPCTQDDANEFWSTLPFPPTGAQRRVLDEIAFDLSGPNAMARLVQGDVGSGKTALAFGALYMTAKAGYVGALMAPTEILAQQHYVTAQQLLEPLGMRCGLLTGSMTAKNKRLAHEALKNGEWDVAIGTHALISEGVEYKGLGLVITDEQHRFGVRQRTILGERGADSGMPSPNVLVMSATPIPRTLALILYGDLDVSVVDELPPGRTPVKTRIVPEDKREAMYEFLLTEISAGRQAYIVCPLVEESEAVDAKPAELLYEELRTGPLSSARVGLAHGRMKAQDKESVLNAFHAGEIDVLVSTTVIEVGVNVPNASVMIIENAERFGLAQLHQLRGRVGRGAAVSWCFLMANSNERLDLLVKTSDGFVIAKKDLEIRGPGELLGYRQSGAAGGLSALMGDVKLLQETHDAARRVLGERGTADSDQLIAMADRWFSERMDSIGVN